MFVKPGVLGVCCNGIKLLVSVATDDPEEVTIETCRREIEAALTSDEPASAIRFELSQVTLLSGSVLGLMVQCVQLGLRVVVSNPSSAARAKLRLTRIDTLVEIETCLDSIPVDDSTTRLPVRPRQEWKFSTDATNRCELSFAEPEFDALAGAAL